MADHCSGNDVGPLGSPVEADFWIECNRRKRLGVEGRRFHDKVRRWEVMPGGDERLGRAPTAEHRQTPPTIKYIANDININNYC